MRIDHFMYAVADLEEGMQWAAETFDAAPAMGGSHIGLGTRNALLSLGDTYLEIIAPDPAQSLAGNLGGKFAELEHGGLVTWAAQGELTAVAKTLANFNIASRGPSRTERVTNQGEHLIWDLLFPQSEAFGARMPFFIDWLDCPHPSTSSPVGGALEQLIITTPEDQQLGEILTAVGLVIEVRDGPGALQVNIACQQGQVSLHSTEQTSGLRMG